jgi:DNA helicase-4
VAITGAKDNLFQKTEKGGEASFLKEAPDVFTVRTTLSVKTLID